MKWDYDERENCWCASRDCDNGSYRILYIIYPVEDGYIAKAFDNALGTKKVAVKNEECTEESVFKERKKLMRKIENREVFWLYTYTSFWCCDGVVAKEEC